MSQEKHSHLPNASELLRAVADYLEQGLLPDIEGRHRYNTRVSINALRILQRELTQKDDEALRQRIQKLIASDDSDDEALLIKLAAQIRDGSLSEENPKLLAVLRQISLNRLAVDNPRYSSYLAATAGRQANISCE
ncbi:MAG: DUF6285 domain-containing protein [Nevskiales bacterium]